MEIRSLNWLSNHKRVAAALVLVYFVLNVFTHGLVQQIAKWIQDELTVSRTNSLVTIIALATLPLFIAVVFFRLRSAPHKLLKLFYCVVTAGLVVGSYTKLFMINMESIHFPQYALIAILVFAIMPRFGETILMVTILGAIDEAHQYWVLDKDADLYLDFNDMILNLQGAAIGVMLLALLIRSKPTAPRSSPYSLVQLFKSPAFITAAGVAGVTLVLYLLGEIALYLDSGAWIVLRRIGPPGEFWITSYWGKTCHILMPLEGVIMIVGMTAFYVFLDFRLALQLHLPPERAGGAAA